MLPAVIVTGARPATLTLGLENYSTGPTGDWSPMLRQAEVADRAGVDRLAVVDHLVLGAGLDEYEGGVFPTGTDGAWLEPLTVLALLAGRTSSVRLSTAVLVAPLRRPAVLAKTLATLDVLSGARLDIGVGVGWHRPEYAATGLDFSRRGELLDECLSVCRALWSEGPTTYASTSVTLDEVWCEPKPVQPGGPPVWLGGTLVPKNAQRIVEFGSGWIPWARHRLDVPGSVAELREVLTRAGRDPDSVVVRAALIVRPRSDGGIDPGGTLEDVPALRRAGVGDFIVRVPTGAEATFDDRLANELVERFREAAR